MNSDSKKEQHYVFASFYQFSALKKRELPHLRTALYAFQDNLLGLIIISKEGINGTVAGSQEQIARFIDYISERPAFQELELKYSQATLKRMPFKKLKIKIKKEIVTMGLRLNTSKFKGDYVEPAKWNAVINDPDTLVIDVRNVYEHRIGTFKNAIAPPTLHFRQFPQAIKKVIAEKQPRKIAMFCTGGIRCEKATAYVKRKFRVEQVYQLHGGILKYLESTPNHNSLWNGKCFVFDGRITVDQNLSAKPEPLCTACGQVMLKEPESGNYVCYQCIEYPMPAK